MKNLIKYAGILAAAMLIVFAFASCGDEEDNAGAGSGPSIENWTDASIFGGTAGTVRNYAVAYGNGTYIVGASDGRIAYSNNLKNWNEVSGNPFGTGLLRSIAYGNNKFVIGGYAAAGGIIGTSTEGASWTKYNAPGGVYDFTSVMWVNNRFVVTSGPRIMYSDTGNEGAWTEAVITPPVNPALNYDFRCVAYGGNRFIASGGRAVDGGYYQPCIAVSTDNGQNWTVTDQSSLMPADNPVENIAYGNGTFIMGGKAGVLAYSTDNGTTWKRVANSTFGAVEIMDITWGNDTFVAVGGHNIVYSSNGITWNNITYSKNWLVSGLYSLCYGDGAFLAGANDMWVIYCKVK